MSERMKVLGVAVDRARLDRVLNETNVYLNTEYLNVIYFAGTQTSIMAQDNEEYAEFVDHSDLVVPGDANIEKQIFGDYREYNKKLIITKYMERLFLRLSKNYNTVYILDSEESRLFYFMNALDENYANVAHFGSCMEDGTTAEDIDQIVNDINSIAPDLLMILMDGIKIMDFLTSSRTKLNARLCICIDEISTETADGLLLRPEIPEIIKKFHLTRLYNWLFRGKDLHTTIVNRMFQKRMKKMNNSEKENENGDDQE